MTDVHDKIMELYKEGHDMSMSSDPKQAAQGRVITGVVGPLNQFLVNEITERDKDYFTAYVLPTLPYLVSFDMMAMLLRIYKVDGDTAHKQVKSIAMNMLRRGCEDAFDQLKHSEKEFTDGNDQEEETDAFGEHQEGGKDEDEEITGLH